MTTDVNDVLERLARRYRALRHSGNSIHVVGAVLKKPVERNTRARIPEVVPDVENKLVADGGSDQGDWPLPVDTDGRPIE